MTDRAHLVPFDTAFTPAEPRDARSGHAREQGNRSSSSVGLHPSVSPAVSSVAMQSHVDVGTLEEPGTPVGLTFNEAVTTLIINCIGAGNILFPYVMADAGMILGPLLLIVCAFTLQLAGSMACNACNIAEDLDGTKITTFEALAKICDPWLEVALIVTKNFAMLGRIITYMQLVVDSVASFELLFPGDEPSCKPVVFIRFAIVFPVFAFLAMITNLKQLARVATLGVVGAISLCACIVFGGVTITVMNYPDFATYSWLPAPSTYAVTTAGESMYILGKAGKYLAVFLFTFAIIATVPSVRSQLQEPRQMNSVLRRVYTYIVIINVIVMCCGYVGFGTQAPEDIINGIGGVAEKLPSVGVIAKVSLIVKVIVGTPLFTFVVINAFEASGGGAWRSPMTKANITMRIMLIFLLNVLGMCLPYLLEGISLASSVFACFNNLIYPALFFYIIRQRQSHAAKPEQCLTMKYAIVGTIGLCLFVFGFKGSLESLMAKIRANADTPPVQC